MNIPNQQQPNTNPPRTDGPTSKPPAGDPPRPSPVEDETGNMQPNREVENRQQDMTRDEMDSRMRDQNAQRQSAPSGLTRNTGRALSYPEAFGVATGEAIHLYWATSERTTMRFYRAISAYIESFQQNFTAVAENIEDTARANQSQLRENRSFSAPSLRSSNNLHDDQRSNRPMR
ncbi:hypothetical protein [Chitinimonas naiadis]